MKTVKNVIKGHMAHDEIERLTIINPNTEDIAIYAGSVRQLLRFHIYSIQGFG